METQFQRILREQAPCYGMCWEQVGWNTYKYVGPCPCNVPCTLTPCPNFLMCGGEYPVWYLNCHKGRCYSCNFTIGYDLKFIKREELPEDDNTCPICFDETNDCFVSYFCGHVICTVCASQHSDPWTLARKIYPHPIADEFGGPDSDDEEEFDKWKTEKPHEYELYEDACDLRDMLVEKQAKMYRETMKRCPVCRCESGFTGAHTESRLFHRLP